MSDAFRTAARRLAAVTAAAAIAATALVMTAAPASAHDQLVSSSPSADATLDALPGEIVLTFSAEIATDEGANEVAVTDAAGAPLAGEPVVQGVDLVVPLEGEADGAITVLWKVVSSDGHPISGEFGFTVTPVATPTPTATATATAAPTPTAEPTPTETASPEPAAADSTFADVWPWILGALIVAALGGAVIYLLVSRMRREKALDTGAKASGAHGAGDDSDSAPGR